MSQKVIGDTFRSTFKKVDKELLRWFPGHMGKGLKQMKHKLRSIDCVVEVHDCRIPLSGRNADFKYTISGLKPHVLVMNKVDLIDKKFIPKITERVQSDCPNIVFTNSKDQSCKGIKKIFPLIQDLINNSDRYNRVNEENYCIMIIGIPNVGKSSLINALRNRFLKMGNAAPVGATPGITRSVMNRIKISEKPLLYMLDTPGILTPNIPNTEVGLKLALCATIQDHLVGENVIADYLLYWLNKQKMYNYVKVFGLMELTDDILKVLTQIAFNEKKYLKIRDSTNSYIVKPDIDSSAKLMLKEFRSGTLGKIMLDQDIL